MKKRIKKALGWLLIMTIVAGIFTFQGFQGQAAQYGVQKNTYLDVRSTPSGKTGQNMTISMVFTNNGSEDLHEVSVRLDSDFVDAEYDAEAESNSETKYAGGKFPFEVTTSTFDAKVIGTVKAGASRTVSLSARVRRDVSEGYYAIPIIVRANGTDSHTEYINVWISKSTNSTESSSGDNGTIQFELGENQSTPTGKYPEIMNFTINLRNASKLSAFDVDVRMGLSEDSTKYPFDINDGNYNRHFDRIGGGESVELPYSMSIRKNVITGYYPITFSIIYRDSTEGVIQKAEAVFYVHVINKDKEEATKEFNANDRIKARIIVDSYVTDPAVVYAGEEFDLTLRMKNASENVAASNILFSLDSEKVTESAVFTTDSGSSSMVVNSLGAGQTTELHVKLRAGAWVDQRAYTVTITEKYDSPEFKNAEEKVSISIPVRQQARLNTGTIDIMPESIAVGSETNIMFPINNTGKVLLYNVMVAFEGDCIQRTDSYLGNIKSGETGNVDAMITGTSPTTGDEKITIRITYEDENGVVSDPIEKEMKLTVTEAMSDDMGMMEGMGGIDVSAEPTGIARYKKYAVPAAIAVLIITGIAVRGAVKKLKVRKKVAEEEDMVDET